jgi:hypothetical protein
MAYSLDLRYKGEPVTISPEQIKQGDGTVSVIYESKGCVSAWIEYPLDPAVPDFKAVAVIAPGDSENVYAPFMSDGTPYVIKASIQPYGHLYLKVLE